VPNKNHKRQYDIAIIATITARSYKTAMERAEKTAMAISGFLEGEYDHTGVARNYEHDNEGQRVLYLHPEDKPRPLPLVLPKGKSNV
jgi:hypothetical protein